jgi:hypothetical protein
MMRAQFIAGAIALLLASCASIFPAPQTPAQAVYEMKAGFLVALHAADDYAALPPCPAQPLCSDTDTVAAIKVSANAAQASLDAAQAVVTNPAFAHGDELLKTGGSVAALVTQLRATITALESENRDPNAEEWAALNAQISAALAALE